MNAARIAIALLLASALPCIAGKEVATPEPDLAPASSLKFSYETEARTAYVGGASTDIGNGRSGDVAESEALLRAVVSAQWNDGPLFRVGFGWQRFSFSLPDRAVLPNTLQSTNLIVGADFSLGDSWLIRIEAQPGIYSDFRDISVRDWNIPFQLGASYIASASVQFVAAIAVNLDHRYPVIPVVGMRWNISGPWTLNAILPNPRLEYEVQKGLLVYVGGDAKSATYRVSEDFGRGHKASSRLNGSIVEYDEFRVGAGVSWKPVSGVTVELEAGYLPYREFDFHRAGANYETKDGGVYGQIGVLGKF